MPSSVDARPLLIALAITSLPSATAVSGQVPTAEVPLPPEVGSASGPAGTSGMGNARYDQVGMAGLLIDAGVQTPVPTTDASPTGPIVAAHARLRPGSVAEVTALDSGRTILVLIDRESEPSPRSLEIALSPAAAALLGIAARDNAPVRVRGVVASASDLVALNAGRPAARRLDTPPAVLTALRQQVQPAPPPLRAPASNRVASATRTAAPATTPAPEPSRTSSATLQPAQGKYLVQVAALSDRARARSLAETLKGYVESTAQLHRVRLGPFADRDSAQRARDAAQRRGYGDATILTQP